MYQGNNPSALRSREEIVNSFMTLLQHSSIDRITIKQIMDTAGLSRQTFYQIFSSKEEILEYYLDSVFGKFTAHYRINTVHNLCDAARLFFGFFEEYKNSLGVIIRSGNNNVLQSKCREYLQREKFVHYALRETRTEQEQEYAAAFVICGMVAMLEQWIREGAESRLSAQDLALLVCRITGSSKKGDKEN